MKNDKYKRPALPKVPSLPTNWGLPKDSITSVKSGANPGARGLSGLKGVGLSSADKSSVSGVKFGSPSSKSTGKKTQTSSVWSTLLGNATSSNSSTGASVLSGLGSGIGSVISGIEKLFGLGGQSTLPPLVEFQLPGAQAQTFSLGNGTTAPTAGVAQNATSSPNVYGAGTQTPLFDGQSQQIVNAVKQALLTSSSLNDVIAEI